MAIHNSSNGYVISVFISYSVWVPLPISLNKSLFVFVCIHMGVHICLVCAHTENICIHAVWCVRVCVRACACVCVWSLHKVGSPPNPVVLEVLARKFSDFFSRQRMIACFLKSLFRINPYVGWEKGRQLGGDHHTTENAQNLLENYATP